MLLTRKVALAGVVLVMVPPSLEEVSAPAGIVLIRFPAVVEVTSTDTVHEPGVEPTWAGTVPPLKDKVVPPGTAVTEPPHEFVPLTGFAMSMPGCTPLKLSVQLALVNENPLGLNIVTARRDVPPGSMERGVKLLFISAGKENPWAVAVFSTMSVEKTNPPQINRDKIDLFIINPVPNQLVSSLKETKPTLGGRFRNWLTTAFSQKWDQRPNQAVDQCTRK